jgi:glycosyltransferase involved in cell wall biosynthesis
MTRFGLIGPTYPFRGGIAHYTTLLTEHLRENHETLLISFTRQYPRWLFPGRSERDPSQFPLKSEAEFILDPINPITWRKTVKQLRSWKPEVVIIPWWVPFWSPAWSAIGRGVKRLPEKPKLIFICHNVLPHESSIIDRAALRLALSPADGYVLHAQADADRLVEIFPDAPFVTTPLPTYEGLGQDAPPISLEIPEQRPLLLFFGFVRPYKGLDVLLQALAKVVTSRGVHLLIVGEFWEDKERYQDQIRELNLEETVTIVDSYVPDEELLTYVKSSDLVVLPYRSATQSAVVQVAFAANKPVITTTVGGLPDVVEDQKTGLLVPPDDPDALAQAIERFFADELGPSFTANIQQESERFSWSHFSKKLFELIDALDNMPD